ncbi:MAG: helix-turn-helix domain-containing protein [Hyphomicrobiales bacterium]|nr:helix-turn-helix domain-containing protein [Hyphomicrobiales bacterium]
MTADRTEGQNGGGSVDLLLYRVGRKVRALRQDRGITRRDLSTATGISERYLGQLENGQANVTLKILQRICDHFGLPLSVTLPAEAHVGPLRAPLVDMLSGMTRAEQEEAHRLLLEKFGGGPRRRKGIALVGLRGAGKTTLGQKLSALTGVPFLRLSRRVAERAGMRLTELMELGGPRGFRRLERETLADLIAEPGQIILETSGGIVGSEEAYDLLLEHFFTVWIKARPEDHMNRVIGQNDLRPMAGRSEAMKDLMGLLDERRTAYGRVDYTLDTAGRGLDDCLAELVEVSSSVFHEPASPQREGGHG